MTCSNQRCGCPESLVLHSNVRHNMGTQTYHTFYSSCSTAANFSEVGPAGTITRYKAGNLTGLEFDLSRSLKVKSNGVIGLTIYGFLLMVNSNKGTNSAPLQDIRL